MINNLESSARDLARTINRLFRPKLYRADTLDGFTNRLRGEKVFTQTGFDANVASIGDDFAARTLTGRNKGIEKLIETVHDTYRAKEILEIPLGRVNVDDFWEGMDTTELRKGDNFYTGVLVSGFNLMFNLALSELYYAVDRFPEGPNGVSVKCRDACKAVIIDAAKYSRNDINYSEERKQFETLDGQRVVRQKPVKFKDSYDASHVPITEDYTHTERSVFAVYQAFADQYKRFKGDTGILKAAIIKDDKLEEDIETALLRLLEEEEHMHDVKPIRMAIRRRLTKQTLSAFSDTREGYDILENLLDQSLEFQAPGWIRRIVPTKFEKGELYYYKIKKGKFGKKLTKFMGYHAMTSVFAHGIVRQYPTLNEAVNSILVLRDINELWAIPIYKSIAFAAFVISLDMIPAALLKGAYKRTKNAMYT